MHRFNGTFEHAIDDKNRVAIPSKYREVLVGLDQQGLMVTRYRSDDHRCLDVYTMPSWAELEAKILAKRRFDRRILRLKNVYISGAHECAPDGQGRILLPQLLRDYAGLKRDVVFTGSIDMFKIWDRDTWKRTFDEDEKIFETPDVLDELEI